MKQLVNSESLSQRPLTFIPADFVQKLTKPLAALPRNLLSDRARKEYHGKLFTPKSFLFWQHCYSNSSTSDNILYIYIYIIGIQQNFGMQQNWAIVPSCSTGLRFLKTADIIEKDPWDLHKGAKCLRDWLDP